MEDDWNLKYMNGTDGLQQFCMALLGGLDIFFLTMYGLVVVVAVISNAVVCYIVISNQRMRSITNLFLLNIAFTDIVKAIVFAPFTFIPNLIYHYWPFGSFMCPLILYFQIVAVFASAFTMVAMSLDRYVAIIYPLRPKLTHKGVGFISTIVWILALLVPLPTAITADIRNPYVNLTEECQRGICIEGVNERWRPIYSLIIMLLQYFIPLTVLTATYVRIGYVIWIKTIPGEAVQQRDQRMANSKRKMVKMMIVVVLLYAFCWLPCHVIQIVTDANSDIFNMDNFKYIWNSATLLSSSHSCCNPIVYFWMNRKFRKGFRKIFYACFCCVKTAQHRRSFSGQSTLTASFRKD